MADASLHHLGAGNGYVHVLDLWRQYVEGLNALRDDKGMAIVQIAHTDVKRFDSPESEPYDRYVIKLHTKASALLRAGVGCADQGNSRRWPAHQRGLL